MTDLDRGLERRLSRRGLLRVMALGGSAALLAACAPAAPASPTAAPAKPAESKPADSKPTAEAKVAEKPTAAPAAKPAEKAAPAAAKGAAEIKIALASEPNSFDPHLTVGRNTQIFIANVFDGLSARDDKNNVTPGLATEWKVLDDKNGWQFKLRQGVKFHNGDDFNAESVKYTIERVIDPATKSTISSEVGIITGADVVDPYTVNIRTKQPDIMLPSRLGELYGGMLSPAHTKATDPATLAIKPNGTGPYKLVEWVKNERLVLEANDSYWRGPAPVRRLTVRPILEDAARIAALQTGEVDFISNVPYERIEELKGNSNLVVKTVRTPRVFFIAIDPRQKPFDDVRVRQALNYAVDVEAIIKSLYLGYAKRLATVIPEATVGYDASMQPYPYDPEKAKSLLAEAGYPSGFSTEFDSFTGSIADHSKAAEAVVEFLRKVGGDVKLNVFEFGAFGPRRVANQVSPLHIYSLGNAYFEPAWAIKWMMQQNLGLFYRNEEIYELCNKAEATFDVGEREKIYVDVQRKLKDDAGFIFLFQNDAAFAMNKKVQYEPRADETQWLYAMGASV
jgi:peptide/nickel transport system substrate-binding protein